MNNPFESIEARLSYIETLLLDLKTKEQNDPPQSDALLTIKQASELLSLSVPTLYSYVQRAEIPVCKRKHRLYFSKTDLLSWIKEGRKQTLQEAQEGAGNYLNKKGGSHV